MEQKRMEEIRQEKTLVGWMLGVVMSKTTKIDCMEASF
jgi:hypothetical protein